MRQELETGARGADEHLAVDHAGRCPATTSTARSSPPSSPAATRSTCRIVDQGLLTVLADATGHGIAPALSVTQMQAMLRMAFRLGANLETAFTQVNNQLADTLAERPLHHRFRRLAGPTAHSCAFTAAGRARSFISRPQRGPARATRRRAFRWARCASPASRRGVTLDPGARRHPAAALGRHLRVSQAAPASSSARSASGAGRRAHHGEAGRQLSAAAPGAVQALRGRRAAGRRHDRRAGEARGRAMSVQPLVPRAVSTRSRTSSRSPRARSRARAVRRRCLPTVDLTLEELFTNMVKYSAADGARAHRHARRSKAAWR